MPTIEERAAEGLLEKMPYDRCLLIPVNPDGTLAGVAVKNMDFDQAMVAAWAFAVGVAQNHTDAGQEAIVQDAMTQQVEQARKRLYVASGPLPEPKL